MLTLELVVFVRRPLVIVRLLDSFGLAILWLNNLFVSLLRLITLYTMFLLVLRWLYLSLTLFLHDPIRILFGLV